MQNDISSRSSRIWFVCSDRNNNKTYKEPGGKKIAKTLNFLDKFYVIGEQGEYLRLAKGRIGSLNDDIIDKEDKIFIDGIDYGWISETLTTVENFVIFLKKQKAPRFQ